MKPSRDIQKLFEHFGGDAAGYQEIGRENEARNARTRWPLLATLDFSQPPIPGIAQHRVLPTPQSRNESAGNALLSAGSATPINRGKPPLFARAHRKTIPPVGNVTLPPANLGGMRFSALAEAPIVFADTPAAPAVESGVAAPATDPSTLSGSSEFMQAALSLRRSPRASLPSLPLLPLLPLLPRVAESTAKAMPSPASSILGRMFEAQAPARQAEPLPMTSSLQSMFQRLRAPDESATAAEPPATASWLFSRAARK